MAVSYQSHDTGALRQGTEPIIPVGYEAGWAPELVGRVGEARNSCSVTVFEPWAIQLKV